MGNTLTKPMEAASEKALAQRLRAIDLDNDDESEYVNVGGDDVPEKKMIRNPEGLTLEVLERWQSTALKDPKNKLALTALANLDPKVVLLNTPTKIQNQQIFNIKVPFEGGPITNQRSSGRCWLFASTNVWRVPLMKRYELEEFQFSQAYLFFWDKLEKSNWFLEQIIDTANEDLDGRLVQHLLGDIVSDGGQWDMFHNLVHKYGLVPHVLYPDRWSASNSRLLNTVVRTKLREFALQLRRLINSRGGTSAADVTAAKDRMMEEISLILTLLLGPPPKPDEEFTWQYLDKNGKALSLTTTPKSFIKPIATSQSRSSFTGIEGMVSLVHDPRHKANTLLTVDRLGNIVGGRDITYINVGMGTLKTACIKMLQAGFPIFFGSDVGKFSENSSGIMDLDLFDYSLGFNTGLQNMSKTERLASGESQMTHAMVLTAVHIDEKSCKPVRWRVQNSWGPDAGDKGFFVMSDRWMDEFVYQAVVDPKFLSKEVQDVLNQDPVVLPVWDPMGSLA